MLRFERDQPRVLVVDDDPMILDLVVTRLSLAGCEVYGARSGAAAIERIRGIRPVAMVLDINMPGLDGFGVLEHMNTTGSIRSIATLMLTARNRPEDIKLAISLGARDYLAKPFSDDQLLVRMARLLRKRETRTAAPFIRSDQDQAARVLKL